MEKKDGSIDADKGPNDFKEILNEVKSQFERDLKINSDLDSKSSNMITTSSGVSTLLMGIGTFLVSQIHPQNWIFNIDMIVLFFGILFSAIAIIFFIRSYRIREFSFPFASANYGKIDYTSLGLFRKKPDFKFDQSFPELLGKDKLDFQQIMIQDYLKDIQLNATILNSKAKLIAFGHLFFLFSIITISLVLVITLTAVASSQTSFSDVRTPIANAGLDFNVPENDTTVLNGNASVNPDGSILSYLWNQISGPTVDLNMPNTPNPSFIAPEVNNDTLLGFKLKIKNNGNLTSDDNIYVKILDVGNASSSNATRSIINETTSGTRKMNLNENIAISHL